MSNSALRRNLVFVAGWVVAGLAIAVLVNQLWPRTTAPAASIAPESAPMATATPAVIATSNVTALPAEPVAALAPPAPATDSHAEGSLSGAVKASAPAVVSIYTQQVQTRISVERVPGGWREVQRKGLQPVLGSGVIVDGEGHIVTNDHVISGANEIGAQINVQLADGRTAGARVVGTDPLTDLAVLKINLPKLPVIKLGRSDQVEVGDTVLAIGNPLGLSQTVTHGIVSATGRARLGIATYEDFIQTDAAINFGNSGGALVNVRGELIGINTAVLGKDQGGEGLSVAIPVDLVRGVLQDILQHGHVVRGWIGLKIADVTEEIARNNRLPIAGVLIWEMHTKSPAKEAGLAMHDRIETVDGQAVGNRQDALARIAARKPGTPVRITGTRARDLQPFSVEFKVIEAPAGVE